MLFCFLNGHLAKPFAAAIRTGQNSANSSHWDRMVAHRDRVFDEPCMSHCDSIFHDEHMQSFGLPYQAIASRLVRIALPAGKIQPVSRRVAFYNTNLYPV